MTQGIAEETTAGLAGTPQNLTVADSTEGTLWVLGAYGVNTAAEFAAVLTDHRKSTLAWLRLLPTVDDATYLKMASTALFDSTLEVTLAGNWYHDHVKATAANVDGRRRDLEAGRLADCELHGLYHQAWQDAFRKGTGEDPEPTPVCGCPTA